MFASYAGNPKNPPWYYNLLANPEVEVEVGNDKFNATATVHLANINEFNDHNTLAT